jgi:hypothetical protein
LICKRRIRERIRTGSARADPFRAKIPEGGRFAAAYLVAGGIDG